MAYGASGGGSGQSSFTADTNQTANARETPTGNGRTSVSYESTFDTKPDTSPANTGSIYNIIGETPGTIDVDDSFFITDEFEDGDLINVLSRKLRNPIFDKSDIEEAQDIKIFELLPKEPTYPDTPPQSLDVYVANWSRVINFGGVTDPTKDPRVESLGDWSIEQWTERHRWPTVATLDPTYMFFTQDPALFYSANAISHYEPDQNGDIQAIKIPDAEVSWLLDGKEVASGKPFLRLSALDRTVEVRDGVGAVIPRTLTCVVKNDKGEFRKDVKFAAINSDDSGTLENVSGLGDSEVDNFSSTYEGSFVYDNNPDSPNYKRAVFEPDPRYEARRIFVRFKWDPFDQDKWSRRRKFKKNTATVTIDGQRVFQGPGTDMHDKFKNRDKKKGRHQDAMAFFPEIFNDNGRLKTKYRNKGGGQLADIGVFDLTQGRKSALFYDEIDKGEGDLYMFEKKPGPFTGKVYLKKRVRKGGWFSKKIDVFYEKNLSFVNNELTLDTAFNTETNTVQDIDLGVFNVSYTKGE
jgi:hypothetical protein